jgi:hypothetical protein
LNDRRREAAGAYRGDAGGAGAPRYFRIPRAAIVVSAECCHLNGVSRGAGLNGRRWRSNRDRTQRRIYEKAGAAYSQSEGCERGESSCQAEFSFRG